MGHVFCFAIKHGTYGFHVVALLLRAIDFTTMINIDIINVTTNIIHVIISITIIIIIITIINNAIITITITLLSRCRIITLARKSGGCEGQAAFDDQSRDMYVSNEPNSI